VRPLPILLALLTGATSATAATITAIEFSGNRQSLVSMLLLEFDFRVGDPLDRLLLEQGRQALLDLGLFRDVRLEITTDHRVIYHLTERHYLRLLPRLRGEGDGGYEAGVDLQLDNLFGRRQRMVIQTTRNTTGSSAQSEFALSYSAPRLAASRYDGDLRLRRQQQPVALVRNGVPIGEYQRNLDRFEIGVAHWLSSSHRSRGPRLRLGLYQEQANYSHRHGPLVTVSDRQIGGVFLGLSLQKVSDHLFYRSGSSYGYQINRSDRFLGTDHDYTSHTLFWRHYQPLNSRQNLNGQVIVAHGSGQPWGGSHFSLGGSLLRGYPDDHLIGNGMALLNLEWHQQIAHDLPSVRGVVFADHGTTWDEATHNGARSRLALGLGLRWRVMSFVGLQLAIDWGFGVATGDSRLFLGTSAPF
jgi:outer membrane protein assembly factor BamA